MWFHVFSVVHTVCKEKPQAFYTNAVVSLVEVISNRFVSPAFNVREVFFEAGVKGASSFIEVELSASSARNTYAMLYVMQLNIFVMFIWDLGPVTLVLV